MAQRAAAKVSRHALATPAPAGYTATAAVPGAAIMADCPPGPIMSAILAAQAYIYGYPLMEYERVRSEAPSLNTLINLTSFANPDVDPIWKAIGGGKGRMSTPSTHWPNSTSQAVRWCCPSPIWAIGTSASS